MLPQASLRQGLTLSIPNAAAGILARKKQIRNFQMNLSSLSAYFLAERQGFEPRVPLGTTVFKTAAIDHSATSPKLLFRSAFL